MRIAFVSYDFGEYCVQHANQLLASGDVMLIMPTKLLEPYRELASDGIDIRTFSKPRLRQPIRQLRIVQWIMKQIADFKPDVIHFQLGHLWFNFALPILQRKYPIVFTVHDPRQHMGDRGAKNTPQWVMDFGYRRADKVIVHGSQLKNILFQELGIPRHDVHVIPHIAIGDGEIPDVATDEDMILFFGRIWPYKGLEYLIRAQPIINQEFPTATFMICGKGEDVEHYRKMMVNPERFVILNRWISDEERAEYFQRSSMVVLPYIEATQSGVVPIAYAHAKPVIATRTGGLPDVVQDGETGLLVEPKDEFGLAKAVIKLLKDKELGQRMGIAGRHKLETELSPAVVCRQTVQVYQQAIDQRNAAKHASKPTSHTTAKPLN